MLRALNHSSRKESQKKNAARLIAARGTTLQQSLQNETGHQDTPTSGQEACKLYSSLADSKAAWAVF